MKKLFGIESEFRIQTQEGQNDLQKEQSNMSSQYGKCGVFYRPFKSVM
jgi:hypothetical protein